MSITVKNRDGEFEGMDESEIQDLARQLTHSTQSSQKGSSGADGEYQPEGEPVVKPARLISRHSTRLSQIDVDGISPFENADSRLDPDSPDFSAKRWIKNLRALQDTDLDYYKPYAMGVLYKDLHCTGNAVDNDFTIDCVNWVEKGFRWARSVLRSRSSEKRVDILKPMDGLVRPGSLVVVLGRPGAGCTTLLKTLASQTYGYRVDKESLISYEGLTCDEIAEHYRGEVIYNAEVETHFAHLTVGQTLNFASLMKVPENRPPGVSRETYADHMTKVYMAMYGLSHTYNTKVGNEFVHGVSGGERKRVSIAEVSLCGARMQLWDNSTRGLDSASAENFVRCLKLTSQVLDTTSIVSIYQCSQTTYDLFDTVVLLYEGRQIFFGDTQAARSFFERQGWECPARQTTADFLTSLTSPLERRARPGFENIVPRTPDEFEQKWKQSPEYAQLRSDIDQYIVDSGTEAGNFKEKIYDAKTARQSKHLRGSQPYTVSYGMQIRYLTRRSLQRIRQDLSLPAFTVIVNFVMALLNGSCFYNLPSDTSAIYGRGACLFFACLFNSLMYVLEVFSLYEARPMIEKHKQYGLYHPSADAISSIISEIPTKFVTSIFFNVTWYFMVNFRRNAGNFFFYFLVATTSTFMMSHMFRTFGASTRTLSQAMIPAAIAVLAMSIFAGFVVPTDFMLGWSRWINYINPIAYTFEAMMINEFAGRHMPCASYVPMGGAYDQLPMAYKVCSEVGAMPGETYVSGTRYLEVAFRYMHSHKWRDWGISVGFTAFFLATYLLAVEFNRSARQKGEKTIFLHSMLRKLKKEGRLGHQRPDDIEAAAAGQEASTKEILAQNEHEGEKILLDSGSDIFHWRDVCYDIPYMGSTRRLLDKVDGWVKPGTLTALMGASGAGKTTLLDTLADRTTFGVVTGEMLVNIKPRDRSFQRSTGYVQQQDLHLETSTVREALRFSAYLRQPRTVSKQEKDDYVENIIRVLEMDNYADAVVGILGEGLNVEQRKRLTIGVELVAKPKLLLFLDEPTSGLDSQTAWSICQLIRRLSDSGQAIMCTIHQPSAMIFSQFDNLLLLKDGGQTVYFGPIGEDSKTLITYFESHGSIPCEEKANPAEWMLQAIGAAPGTHPDRDWFQIWRHSKEYKGVAQELERLSKPATYGLEEGAVQPRPIGVENSSYASSLWAQYYYVTKRVFQQYWRTPSYIYSKIILTVLSHIFIGFTFFKAHTSIQGLQNQMFAIFMFTAIFAILVEQMLPHFVSQRELYEARERPSKTFSWFAFISAQITVEIPWMVLCGTISFCCFYFPVDFRNNARVTGDGDARATALWLLIIEFFIWTSTLGQLCIAGIEVDQNAANLAVLLFALSLLFCGVLVTRDDLPGFWIFMYRVSPMTYWVQGFMRAALGSTPVTCADSELLTLTPYPLQTCQMYLHSYMEVAGGYLLEPNSTETCQYCRMANTDAYLQSVNALDFTQWEVAGMFWAYIIFDVAATIVIYWMFRVPHQHDPIRWIKTKVFRRKPLQVVSDSESPSENENGSEEKK